MELVDELIRLSGSERGRKEEGSEKKDGERDQSRHQE